MEELHDGGTGWFCEGADEVGWSRSWVDPQIWIYGLQNLQNQWRNDQKTFAVLTFSTWQQHCCEIQWPLCGPGFEGLRHG